MTVFIVTKHGDEPENNNKLIIRETGFENNLL